VTTVIETSDLGRQYGRKWALQDCTLSIPEGKVVGLVGPNGAGKTTLLSLAVGLLAPTRGSITVLGGHPGDGPAQLGKVGFVAQDTPAYAGLSYPPWWPLADRCAAFHAVITGSISAHRSSVKSLG
jgi:ABC-2 type transport system ATP-binding protein